MTHDEIVDTYIREYREGAHAEMRVFVDLRSPSAAIRMAALSLRADGKRQDHQRRIPKQVLDDAEVQLQTIRTNIAKATDFDALHRLVLAQIGPIRGVGELTVYDIAHRIGCYLGKHPERVYLHAGTKVGARAFGMRGTSFDPAVLPRPFARLSPAEIEDVLCIFADALAGRKKGRNNNGSRCVVPRKSAPPLRRGC